MRQNVPIDEILDSLKKMMDNKSSRISRYLVQENNYQENNYYDNNIESNNQNEDEEEEILELTEEAIIAQDKDTFNDAQNANKINLQENKNYIEKNNNDVDYKEEAVGSLDGILEEAKISDKTASETSMYLKYLSDKSATIKNSKEKTINEFIKEAAMPYVIEWLDKNLNKLVKEIVEKEIKRITSDDK